MSLPNQTQENNQLSDLEKLQSLKRLLIKLAKQPRDHETRSLILDEELEKETEEAFLLLNVLGHWHAMVTNIGIRDSYQFYSSHSELPLTHAFTTRIAQVAYYMVEWNILEDVFTQIKTLDNIYYLDDVFDIF